jgi:hypothetical protein
MPSGGRERKNSWETRIRCPSPLPGQHRRGLRSRSPCIESLPPLQLLSRLSRFLVSDLHTKKKQEEKRKTFLKRHRTGVGRPHSPKWTMAATSATPPDRKKEPELPDGIEEA